MSTTTPEALYYVDIDHADDPDGSSSELMTAAEICGAFPFLAPLITGDGTESLDYVHELTRFQIAPSPLTTTAHDGDCDLNKLCSRCSKAEHTP